RSEAQQRADDIRTFRAEMERLSREQVLRLDPATREAIERHHEELLARLAAEFDIDRDAQAKQLSFGMRVASFLGALALAAGIVFLGAFIAARMGTWSGLYWIDFGARPENFFVPALAAFLVPQFIDHRRFTGFATTYRVFGLLGAFIPMLILANWGDASYIPL